MKGIWIQSVNATLGANYCTLRHGTGKGVDEWMSTPLSDLVEWAEVVDEAIKEELKGSKH
jgi:hypothetical protein